MLALWSRTMTSSCVRWTLPCAPDVEPRSAFAHGIHAADRPAHDRVGTPPGEPPLSSDLRGATPAGTISDRSATRTSKPAAGRPGSRMIQRALRAACDRRPVSPFRDGLAWFGGIIILFRTCTADEGRPSLSGPRSQRVHHCTTNGLCTTRAPCVARTMYLPAAAAPRSKRPMASLVLVLITT